MSSVRVGFGFNDWTVNHTSRPVNSIPWHKNIDNAIKDKSNEDNGLTVGGLDLNRVNDSTTQQKQVGFTNSMTWKHWDSVLDSEAWKDDSGVTEWTAGAVINCRGTKAYTDSVLADESNEDSTTQHNCSNLTVISWKQM